MALDHFSVTRGTTKTVLNKNGVLETVPANVPAFEFNPDGTFKGCLIEPSATNLFTHSRDLENVAWIKTNIITPSQTNDAIWQSYNSWKVIPDGVDNVPSFRRTTPNSSIGVSTYFIIKRLGTQTRYVSISFRTGGVSFRRDTFDLQTNQLVASSGLGTRLGTIRLISNGYFLIDSTTQGFNWSGGNINVFLSDVLPTFNTTGEQTNTYIGNETDGILFAHGQCVAGNIESSSAILTTTSTATRNADVIDKTGASGLIGQTEGSVYMELNRELGLDTGRALEINDGTSANRIAFIYGSNVIVAVMTDNGIANTINGFTSLTNNKICITYANGVYDYYLNGTKIGNSTFSFNAELTNIPFLERRLDRQWLNGHIRSFALYKRALTEAEAIKLTTL